VEAARVSGPTEQLERFCYKMSVRLHWLARSLPAKPVDTGVSGNPSRRWWGNMAVSVAILSALGLAAGFGVVRLIRSRRPRSEGGHDGPFLLPETEPCPRFGAPHSGGFSAVITFPRQSAP
jgi:hypothetical protein